MALFTTRRKLATVLTRRLSSSSSSFSTLSSRSRFAVPLIDKLSSTRTGLGPCYITTRPKTSGSGYSPLNDPSPNWSNRPPKETILLDGCDYEHWLIVMEFNDPKPTEDEMINAYVKTLTSVVGSEEEAKKKIYSVSTSTYTGFGALISEELSCKVKDRRQCKVQLLPFTVCHDPHYPLKRKVHAIRQGDPANHFVHKLPCRIRPRRWLLPISTAAVVPSLSSAAASTTESKRTVATTAF
ncbi:hypothetical protein N665_0385s0007 [Sinapis alba]|nr:hypothetical protein N665_0385s0007 [Sinapis alba]